MAASMSDALTIRHAYRALLRASLLACQYSIPARYQVRDTMRRAFRKSPPHSFDSERIANTLYFLKNAAERAGLEHKIVKNILKVRYWETQGLALSWKPGSSSSVPWNAPEAREGYRSFERTVEMLNQTMGLCLK